MTKKSWVEVEVEHKFVLCPQTFLWLNLNQDTKTRITQGYYPQPGVRIRTQTTPDQPPTHTLTTKTGQPPHRTEHNQTLTSAQANIRWAQTVCRITKNRYVLPQSDGHVYEVDEYLGDLTGLYVVEVEFASLHTANTFVPPVWFGKNVTQNPNYSNEHLAKHGKPQPPHPCTQAGRPNPENCQTKQS